MKTGLVDYELLNAISDLLDKKLEEKLETKLEEKLDQKLEPIYHQLYRIETRMDNLETRMDNLETRMDRNYNVLLDFYDNQREFNAQIAEYMHVNYGSCKIYAQASS